MKGYTDFSVFIIHNHPAIVHAFDYTSVNKGKDRSGSTPYANKRNRKHKPKRK